MSSSLTRRSSSSSNPSHHASSSTTSQVATAAPKDSFDAFAAVDQVVSKPVLGSDGAASWQQFQQEVRHLEAHVSTAPKAPLKKSDKLGTGFTSWEEERLHENQLKQQSGITADGYVHFKQKNSAEDAAKRKEIKRIQQRIRPKEKEYYLKAETFEGYKFDYVFTTRDWGTGYYWDGMDSLKQLQQQGDAMVVISKDDDEEDDDQKDNGGRKKNRDRTDDTTNTAKTKKKRKRSTNEGPVFVNDPNNPLEQVANALQRRQQQLLQQQHRFSVPPPLSSTAVASSSSSSSSLPSGWEAAADPTTGKIYYFCRATGQRQWDAPSSAPMITASATEAATITTLSSAEAAVVSQDTTANVRETITQTLEPASTETTTTTPSSSQPEGWHVAKDATTGKEYYFHTNGTTTWERPSTA